MNVPVSDEGMNADSGQDSPSNESSESAIHADKYNDPRVSVSRRGILLCVAILILGIVGAALSIRARRTRLEKSLEFWGQDTITAFQLAEKVELIPLAGKEFDPVNLSGTPGLGHLRHTLLDERSYLWETREAAAVSEISKVADAYCVKLRWTDPTANRFTDRTVILDLNTGWAGHDEGGDETAPSDRRVQLIERVRPALKKFLETLINVQQQRYGNRP